MAMIIDIDHNIDKVKQTQFLIMCVCVYAQA